MMSRRVFLLDLTFLFIFSYSIFSLLLRLEVYSRPYEYFILTSLIISLIAVEIIYIPPLNGRIFLVLFKILLLAASLRLIPQFLFPGLIGIDPWWHQMFTTKIMDFGRVPLGYGYSKMPVFHLVIALTSSITSLDYKLSAIVSIGFLNIISLIFIFLIGRELYNYKLGLLSALIAGIADWYINAGFWIIPNTLGAAFILALIYLILKQKFKFSFKSVGLILVISATLIMTHPLSSLAMALLLMCFLLGPFLFGKICIGKYRKPIVTITFSALFAIAMVAYWGHISGHIFYIANAISHALRLEHLITHETVFQYRYEKYVEFLLSAIGNLIFYITSMAGIVLSFMGKKVTEQSSALAFGGIVVTAIAFSGYMFSLSGLYPSRWFYYSQPLMAVFAGLGLFFVTNKIKDVRKAISVVFSIMMILSFFSITSPVSNIDSPIYSQNITIRFFFHESEIRAATFVKQVYQGEISSDSHYTSCFKTVSIHDFSKNIVEVNFNNLKGIIIRKYIFERPFYIRAQLGTFKISYDIISVFEETKRNRVYDSAEVFLYI